MRRTRSASLRHDRQPVGVATVGGLRQPLARVAERAAPGDAAALRLALEAAARRVGDALALLLADDALEREHEVVDHAGRYGVDRHVVEPQDLRHVLEVLLVAPQPVDVLDDQRVDAAPADGGEHRLKAGPLHRRAGDPVVAVEADQLEAVPLRAGLGEVPLAAHGGGLSVGIVEALAPVGQCATAAHPHPRPARSGQHSRVRFDARAFPPARRAAPAAARGVSMACRRAAAAAHGQGLLGLAIAPW